LLEEVSDKNKYMGILQNNFSLYEKINLNFKTDLDLNKEYFSLIQNFSDLINSMQNKVDKIQEWSNYGLKDLKTIENQLNTIIEKKQNSMIVLKQIKNAFSEKIENLENKANLTDEMKEESDPEKQEKIDFGINRFIENKFEFSGYVKNDYNEFENERANTEKMHSFQVSLMEIFKGEQETKHMRMNLLSELEDFQGFSNDIKYIIEDQEN